MTGRDDERSSFLPVVASYDPRASQHIEPPTEPAAEPAPPPQDRDSPRSTDPLVVTDGVPRPRTIPPGLRKAGLLGLVVVLVVAGFALVRHLEDDRGRLVSAFGTTPLDAAVTSRPSRQWRTELPGAEEVDWVQDLDGDVLVGWSGRGGRPPRLGRLDDDGDLRWSREIEEPVAYGHVADDVFVAFLNDSGTSRVEAFDLATGRSLWTDDDSALGLAPHDGVVLLADDARAQARDLRSGERRWSAAADDELITDDAIFLRDGAEIERRDVRSGDVRWRATGFTVSDDGEGNAAFVAGEDALLVCSDEGVTILDIDSGETLGQFQGIKVDLALPLGGERFVLVRGGRDRYGEDTGSVATVVEPGRVRGFRDLGHGPTPAFVVHDGGDLLVVSDEGGPVLDGRDDRLREVITLPTGPVRLYTEVVADGYYQEVRQRLSFYDRRGRKVWTMTLGNDETYHVGDGRIYVTDGESVTAYR